MNGLLSGARAQWLHDLPARTTLKLFNQRHVRTWLGNRHAAHLERHRPKLPRLAGHDREVVSALQAGGVCVTSLDRLGLPASQDILATSATLAEDFAREARERASGGQAFIIVPPGEIVRNAQIYRWGLQDRLLDIAEAYLGLPAAYDGVAINYTVADGREISTRKWHRDWEDRRMLKVAVYLHEVDAEGGPFQLISRHDTGQNDARGFDYELADDSELQRRLGADFERDIVSCEGPRGTVVFSDTAGFYHRGKPATRRDRSALFYSYFASPPRHPFLCERTGIARGDVPGMVEPLPERQRRAALWRRQLPPFMRLIPPASL